MNEPKWTDEQVSQLLELVWESGVLDERRRIAEAVSELEACWRAVGTRTHQSRVQARRDEMKALADASGRPEWPGHEGMSPAERLAAYGALIGSWDTP